MTRRSWERVVAGLNGHDFVAARPRRRHLRPPLSASRRAARDPPPQGTSVAPDVNPPPTGRTQHDPQRLRTLRPPPDGALPARGFQRPRPASSRQGSPRRKPPPERHLLAPADRDAEGLPQPGVDQADAVAIAVETATAASPKARRRRVFQSDALYSSAATMAGGAVSAPDAMASASSAASTSSTGVSTSMSRCLYAVRPVPAGMSRPMITFSLSPRR